MISSVFGAELAFGIKVEVLSGSSMRTFEGQDEVLVIRDDSRIRVSGTGTFDLLVVGGGGGGGALAGGGGGGGQVVYQTGKSVAADEYDIVVGKGGAGSKSAGSDAANGTASCAFGVEAAGGGAGGTRTSGKSGASGGGGGAWGGVYSSREGEYPKRTDATLPGGVGTIGFNGGACTNTTSGWHFSGGGGGGAGSVGEDGVRTAGGAGGAGVQCAIYAAIPGYGGGGGGGMSGNSYDVSRAAGKDGGGNGGAGYDDDAKCKGQNGTDLTGGGGGGGGGYDSQARPGGKGGDGVVILRFRHQASEIAVVPVKAEDVTGGECICKKGFAIHTFTEDGTLTVSKPMAVDLLLVGGGGGGGYQRGGGGGGGGVIVLTNVYLSAGSYHVSVGAGGAGGVKSSYTLAENGNPTSLKSDESMVVSALDIVAQGGGGGGSGNGGIPSYKTATKGKPGASGGGGAGWYTGDPLSYKNLGAVGGAGVSGQGYDGGVSTNVDAYTSYAGGGGGAGGKGEDGLAVNKRSGQGGVGLCCDFSGTARMYGGGGAGGSGTVSVGTDGVPQTGGGGGGGGGQLWDGANGGAGGSGIVIVRHRLPPKGLILFIR